MERGKQKKHKPNIATTNLSQFNPKTISNLSKTIAIWLSVQIKEVTMKY